MIMTRLRLMLTSSFSIREFLDVLPFESLSSSEKVPLSVSALAWTSA